MNYKIISIAEIEEILSKYNIGKKPLSLVLGWGEVTIIRYLEGQVPDKFHSDVLLKISDDYNEFLNYLEKNRNLITEVAYKKSMGKIMEIKLEEDKSIIYLVSKHIIANIEDISPLALQKILYYVNGFSLALLDKDLFMTKCEAWEHGPVYREIYKRFSYYSYHSIEKNEFQDYFELTGLSKEEIGLIDEVIKCFGCYSGKTLEKMSHFSLPWQETRTKLEDGYSDSQVIESEKIKIFFKKLCEDYHILEVKDISRYSNKLFRKVVK